MTSLPIVVASGYPQASLRERFPYDPCLGFVGKPYDGAGLAAALGALGVAAPGAA